MMDRATNEYPAIVAFGKKCTLCSYLQSSQLCFQIDGIRKCVGTEPKLFSHHGLDSARAGYPSETQKPAEISGTITALSSGLFISEAGLLAQCGGEHHSSSLADEVEHSAHEFVHGSITLQNRRPVIPLLFQVERNLKSFRLHIAPIAVLHVGSGIQEESGKGGSETAIHRGEYIELQLFQDEGTPPAARSSAFLGNQ